MLAEPTEKISYYCGPIFPWIQADTIIVFFVPSRGDNLDKLSPRHLDSENCPLKNCPLATSSTNLECFSFDCPQNHSEPFWRSETISKRYFFVHTELQIKNFRLRRKFRLTLAINPFRTTGPLNKLTKMPWGKLSLLPKNCPLATRPEKLSPQKIVPSLKLKKKLCMVPKLPKTKLRQSRSATVAGTKSAPRGRAKLALIYTK